MITTVVKWMLAAMLVALAVGLDASHVVHAQDAVGSKIFLPVVVKSDRACSQLHQKTYFGVQVYGESTRQSPYYNDLLESGASWIRTEGSWASVEPENTTPDKYNWAPLDKVVGSASDGCINIVLTHDGAPGWAATYPSGPIDRTPLAELAEYMGAVAERYDADGYQDAPNAPLVQYFEMYNEPDAGYIPGIYHWGNDGDQYAAMLKAVYPAIKAANPNAKVILGGIAYEGFIENNEGGFVKAFITDVLDNGGGDYFDIMCFHTYPYFAPNWTGVHDGSRGPGLFEKAAFMRDLLKQYGYDKPIVITEAGWHSDAEQYPPSNQQQQNSQVVALFMQSIAAKIDFTIWWLLYDIGPNYQFQNGLVTNVGEGPVQRKESFSVFQVLTREFSQLRFVARLRPNSATDQLEVYEFRDDGNARTVYVLWRNPIDNLATTTYRISASTVTVRDMFWNARTVKDADNGRKDKSIALSVTGVPMYVEVND
jgi:hypothetical protein